MAATTVAEDLVMKKALEAEIINQIEAFNEASGLVVRGLKFECNVQTYQTNKDTIVHNVTYNISVKTEIL